MQYTHLGRSGLLVSRLCLGTMNFGPDTSEADSCIIMDAAVEAGINFFDTADVYGKKMGEGVTEQILGNWFAQGGRRRDRVILATKLYGRMSDWPNDSKLSARHIKLACEASLKRLQTDYIDLYQMHHIDRETPWEEIWQAMEQLVREGKILYVGSSNFAAWNIAQANCIAKQRNFLGLVSEQSIYHLNNRMVELEVIPACREFGVGLIPWSPLGGGVLGGMLGKADKVRRNSEGIQKRLQKDHAKIEAYEKFCKELGHDPAHVALAWLLHQQTVTAPILGPRTLEQLTGILPGMELKLSTETLKKLDEIFPGPGNQAPEAYAW